MTNDGRVTVSITRIACLLLVTFSVVLAIGGPPDIVRGGAGIAVAILTLLGGGIIASVVALWMASSAPSRAVPASASVALLCMNAGAALCVWGDHARRAGHNLFATVAAVSGTLVGSIYLEYLWSRRRRSPGPPAARA